MANEHDYYWDLVQKYPLLDRKEEQKLAAEACKGNKKAQDELVKANLRFVLKVASKYKGLGLDKEDLINEGNIGLIIAAQKYNPEKSSARFITYASYWIIECIQRAVRDTAKGVRFPANRFKEMKEEKWNIASLDKPMSEDNDASLYEMLCDDDTKTPEEAMLYSLTLQDVSTALAVLSPRERLVIEKRFGLNGTTEIGLRELGLQFDMTKEGIRQIEVRAIKKLKTLLERTNAFFENAA